MSVNLSVKDVPDDVADRLRARAARNHRSLQGELRAIIDEAVPAPDQRMPVLELYEHLKSLGPPSPDSSVDLIRHMRDTRYGDEDH